MRKTVGSAQGKTVGVASWENAAVQPNVISLTLLNDLLPHKDPLKFRHSYQLSDGDDFLDKDCFRIDVIELPKLQQAMDTLPPRQKIWMRLFLAQSYAEVRQLAREEPLFSEVCEVLEMVSKNSKMQDRARMIWEGEFAVRNEKYLLEKERLEEKARLEKEYAEEKARLEREYAEKKVRFEKELAEKRVKLESEHAAEKVRLEKDAEQRIAAAQQDAEQRVGKTQQDAEQRVAKAQHALSTAVRNLHTAGQTIEAISNLLNLPSDVVVEILNSNSEAVSVPKG